MAEKIVILDGFALNPGDLDWQTLQVLGDVYIHDRTPPDLIVQRSQGATCLLVNKVALTREIMEALPDLRYVGILATGFNIVDMEAASERNIVVTNIPTYGTNSVAQHTAALMLEFARGVCIHDEAVKNGEWTHNDDWCFARQPMFELSGKTLGIVGIGRIGQAVARIGAAMGMKLIAHDKYWPDASVLAGLDVDRVAMDELFAVSDVITLHCPLTPENYRLVNSEKLNLMKSTALLLNTSRGALIDNQALADALNAGVIGGAGLDVLESEPPSIDNPLLTARNCRITPHIAWYAKESRSRLLQTAAENLSAFLKGRVENRVN